MFQNKINNILYDIAQEEGLTYKEVKNIIKSYFLFSRIKMALGSPEDGRESFKQLRLPGFGNFTIYERMIKKFKSTNSKLTEDQRAVREKYRIWDELNTRKNAKRTEFENLKNTIKIDL